MLSLVVKWKFRERVSIFFSCTAFLTGYVITGHIISVQYSYSITNWLWYGHVTVPCMVYVIPDHKFRLMISRLQTQLKVTGLRRQQGTFYILLSKAKLEGPNHSQKCQFLFQVRDNFTNPTNDVILALGQAIVPRKAFGKLDQLLLKRLEQSVDKVRV